MTDTPTPERRPIPPNARIEQFNIVEPSFVVVLTHHDTGGRGEARHSPEGCPGNAGRMAEWNHPGQRDAYWFEMTSLDPCELCLAQLR